MEPSTIPVPDYLGCLASPVGVVAELPLTIAECQRRLQLWANYDGQEDEDGIVWPSRAALHKTQCVLLDFSEATMPMFMSPDTDGGVSLEWRAGGNSVRVLIDSDGEVTKRVFREAALAGRGTCRTNTV